MSYNALFLQEKYETSTPFTPLIELSRQPKLAFVTLLLALLTISLALATAGSSKGFVQKFIYYTILTAIGSLFFGIGTVFLSNSFGVYV
ncbi:Dolichyl-diphosphooligosaccharide--protein glycosyltransferase subunit OST5 [Nakaseomyces glabratus]|nr:Dolichyl-diphosphooligosaccharide--protein glycosyltransferase subunit OST5 [Nakaseomyces glabratus]KTB14485.1 Dolichyl-diphosphooligosaccharide--protein glycosyltransferase subunit OST5 [Nakaseomyces glabratus]